MDIVDTQVHANRLGPDWRTADLATTVDLTVAAMDAVGVTSTLIAEMWASEVLSTDELHATRLPNGAWRFQHPFSELAVKTYPDRFGYVYRIDPLDPDAPDLLAEVRRKPGSLCTRIAPTLAPEQAEAFATGGMDAFFAAAERHEVPVFIFLSTEPDALAPYARRFPGLSFIVDHWGFPMPGDRGDRGWEHFEAKVLPLAALPNVCLKWCKGPRFVSQAPYPHHDLAQYMRRSLDAFGAARILWASDNTVSKGKTTWAEEIYHVRDSPVLDAAEKALVLGGSARRVLRWPR